MLSCKTADLRFLGCYDGAGAIQRAYADYQAGVLPDDTTGIMIHHVIEQVDRGEPILVKDIVVQPGETLEQLTERMHGFEHELIVNATAIKTKQILAQRSVS